MTAGHALALAAMLAVLAVPASADPALPAAVGRIKGAPWGHCTAVLIAPDLVLTHGSCLTGPLGGLPDAPGLTFRAGLTPAGALAEARGARLILHPSLEQGRAAAPGYYADAAVLVLAAPLPGAQVAPMVARDAATGRDYAVAHYPPRRRDGDAALVLTCRAFPFRAPYRPFACDDRAGWGAKGAVVLDLDRGRAAVAGLVLPANRSGGGLRVNTMDAGPAIADLVALAAGRAVPPALRGGVARAGRELPGRFGIVGP